MGQGGRPPLDLVERTPNLALTMQNVGPKLANAPSKFIWRFSLNVGASFYYSAPPK